MTPENCLLSKPAFPVPSGGGDTNNIKLSLSWLPLTLNQLFFSLPIPRCIYEKVMDFSDIVEIEELAFFYL